MRKHRRGLLKGMPYGPVVYSVNYRGWIPAAGVLRPPHNAPKACRNDGRVGAALDTVCGLIGIATRKGGTAAKHGSD